ncbi:MAG: PspC domain-containing protein [Cryomorphaceae bacterium]|nr:MAG: PspC domain-containing protein [Cryomorphaceae bacterium]
MQRQLLRYPKKGMLGGVCYGLAEHFNTDPTLIRIIFILLFLFVGGGLLAYLILWIVVPAAKEI